MASDTGFSLLYPRGRPDGNANPSGADAAIVSALGAESLFGALRYAPRFKPNQKHPIAYFTDDIEVIRYRLDAVEDLLNHEALFRLLEQLLPELEDMKELHMARQEQPADTTADLAGISEIELYVGLMDKLYDCFGQDGLRLKSAALRAFAAEIKRIRQEGPFAALKAEYAKMTQSIRAIKSVTIGVNLDARLRPLEAGVVSINTERFRSGHIIDKLLRADFSDDGFNCLAPLEVAAKGLTNEQIAGYRSAVNSALQTALKGSLKSWRPAVRAYTLANSGFLLRLVDDVRFLLGGVSLLRKLQAAGVPICKPAAAAKERRMFEAAGLYNPVVALRQHEDAGRTPSGRVVLNPMQFDENGMIYILTGPNQGGKTVFVQAVGIAQLLFQLGLFVPAVSATFSPVDRIYAHFPDEQHRSTGGRFAEECERLMRICRGLTRHSLLLLDETFSGTSAAEATYIAEQVLLGLRAIGCRVLFSTHLHDLARHIDELNERTDRSGSRIDSLTAEAVATGEQEHTRSYVIRRSRPHGHSYARDIAEKYGLTYEALIAALEKKEGSG